MNDLRNRLRQSYHYHSYTIASPPLIQAGLTVTHNGCPTTSVQNLNILPPIPKFGYSVICPAYRLIFMILRSWCHNPHLLCLDYGDGSPVEIVTTGPPFTPAGPHLYPGPGSYNATLTILDNGCTAADLQDRNRWLDKPHVHYAFQCMQKYIFPA